MTPKEIAEAALSQFNRVVIRHSVKNPGHQVHSQYME